MLEAIAARRSIRSFSDEPVTDATLDQIITLGAWAPSGLNNQPWRFFIVRDPELKKALAAQTKYGRIIDGAAACIAVFLNNAQSYDRLKDLQAVGACIQNMLLAIHQIGLGAVWLGEILKNRQTVEKLLEVPEDCELMAVIALGHPAGEGAGPSSRKPISALILGRR